ncbi:MAG: hypothetical protein HYZ28_14790 [Myxococcales bacterium]|nr:hypothetical protein [Myxococcales bacterium]
MLEIIFLIWFGRKLARMANEKGRSKGWAALGVFFWIGGELMGFIVAGLLGIADLGGYGLALVFAGVGAGVSYAIVKSLPSQSAAAGPAV